MKAWQSTRGFPHLFFQFSPQLHLYLFSPFPIPTAERVQINSGHTLVGTSFLFNKHPKQPLKTSQPMQNLCIAWSEMPCLKLRGLVKDVNTWTCFPGLGLLWEISHSHYVKWWKWSGLEQQLKKRAHLPGSISKRIMIIWSSDSSWLSKRRNDNTRWSWWNIGVDWSWPPSKSYLTLLRGISGLDHKRRLKSRAVLVRFCLWLLCQHI